MNMEELIYCSLVEDTKENFDGWDKETIEFVTNNKSKVYQWIVKASCSKNGSHPIRLNTEDKEDIYSEILTYLYSADDYNFFKACDKVKGEGLVNLEGYVFSCVKNCTKRYISRMYKHNCNLVREAHSKKDDKEISILDSVVDQHAIDDFDKIGYKIDDICRSYECYRYQYGADLFLVLYIRLLTMGHNEKYMSILEVLGISKADLANVQKQDTVNEIFVAMVKCITVCGIELALPVIENYVYDARQIYDAINVLG